VESAAVSLSGHGGRAVLEVLSEEECIDLLGRAHVGRVGVTVGAIPAIFPVHYAMLGRSVVFRTARGTKLEAALKHTVVAFEVDDVDESGSGGWSVLVVGMASKLTGHLLDEALALPLDQWAPVGAEHVVTVAPDFVSGRRLVRVPTG